MRTSGEKVRISDEAERVQLDSYPHKIIVGVVYVILLSLMPIEKTRETRVRTDCLMHTNFLKIQLEEEGIWIIFLWNFLSRYSSRLHKIS